MYPNLELEHLKFNQDGISNDVVIINQERVWRFPKTKRAKQDLAREAKVLQLIQYQCDVNIVLPKFEYLKADFVSYGLIKGELLSRNRLLKLDSPI